MTTARTDAAGVYTATLDLAALETLVPNNPRDAERVPSPVEVHAYWAAPTGRLALQNGRFEIQGPAGNLFLSTSIKEPVLPGVALSIVVDRFLSPGVPTSGPAATITAAPVSPALCAQLASCDSGLFSDVAFDARIAGTGELARLVNMTESALVAAAGAVICEGVEAGAGDWAACRWELPAAGLYALMACSPGVEEQCSVVYRCGATPNDPRRALGSCTAGSPATDADCALQGLYGAAACIARA